LLIGIEGEGAIAPSCPYVAPPLIDSMHSRGKYFLITSLILEHIEFVIDKSKKLQERIRKARK
jgi:hypothetical protein